MHRPLEHAAIEVERLNKSYDDGFEALKSIDLSIRHGEIFALLGPNGAGKTTLINAICGIVTPTSGRITVSGYDNHAQFRHARALVGLVPQELTTEAFETVWATVNFSRGLFGKPPDDEHLAQVLRDLSLWDKRHNKLITLSGGMKRRVLIAKALAHEPRILFLDEPTAGVDVELRRDMWEVVRRLRDTGVTIVLTTHYIEEAEQMADRVGVINNGELILIENKIELMQKLGQKRLILDLNQPISAIPDNLQDDRLALGANGTQLVYTYDTHAERTGITALLQKLRDAGIHFHDVHTKQSSLEEIFVSLVRQDQ